MPDSEPRVDQATNVFSPAAMVLLSTAQKQIEAFAHARSELAKTATEINQYWAERGQSEAGLASELASKLAFARSVSDAMTAWQEWNSQRIERMTEDSKHLLADIQEVVKAGARLLPNGGAWANGPATLTS